MNQPLTLGDLSRPEWDEIQAALDRFEAAWDGADDVDLVPFLPPWGDRLRAVYLYEFVKTDLEMRWRRGQRTLVEDYLKRFTELKSRPAELPKLLAEEYRARQFAEGPPPFSDYQKRFPEHFSEFCRLVGTATNNLAGSGTLKPGGPERPAPPPPPQAQAPQSDTATIRADAATAPAPAKGSVWSEGVLPVGGGYKLIRRLGAGQFGEVWLAEAPGGVEVAVKIIRRGLDQAEAQRELQALEATKRLRHSYLLQLQAYWSLEDRLIIAMELADGTLTDELKKHNGRGIPIADLLRYMEEAAEVLDFLHDQQVVHRDVKPENILLMRGHVKLADLGLARLMMGRSFTGTTAGSPAYMAPEVWQGRAARTSDQYSLAASYVQLRLNHSLFPGTDMYGIMLAHLRETPELAELATTERTVLLKALAKDPKQRFPNCTEFVRALRRAVEQKAADKSKVAAPPRRRWAVWGIVLAGLFGAALVIAAMFSPPPSSPTTELATQPAAHKPLPDGYDRAEGAILEEVDGKSYYSHIIPQGINLPSEYAGQATFILIKPPADSEVKTPFYFMQHKVSNRFFRAVLEAHRNKLPEGWPRKEWDHGAKSLAGKDLPIEGPAPGGGDYLDFPVFRVNGNDAEKFAGLIGGHLPTADEWSVPAGFSPNNDGDDEGPFQGSGAKWKPGDFALEIEGTRKGGAMPVGKAKRDRRSVEGPPDDSFKMCYDMASNGYEWTATAVNPDNSVSIPRIVFRDNVDVPLRLMGETYKSPAPLPYNKWFSLNSERSQAIPYPAREADISFRIVVRPDRQR